MKRKKTVSIKGRKGKQERRGCRNEEHVKRVPDSTAIYDVDVKEPPS